MGCQWKSQSDSMFMATYTKSLRYQSKESFSQCPFCLPLYFSISVDILGTMIPWLKELLDRIIQCLLLLLLGSVFCLFLSSTSIFIDQDIYHYCSHCSALAAVSAQSSSSKILFFDINMRAICSHPCRAKFVVLRLCARGCADICFLHGWHCRFCTADHCLLNFT